MQRLPDGVSGARPSAAVHRCSAADDGAVLGANNRRPLVKSRAGDISRRGSHGPEGAREKKAQLHDYKQSP